MEVKLNKFVCVLRKSKEFKAKHVIALKQNLEWALPNMDLFICISDVKIPGVFTIPFWRDYPGKWSMHEVFRITGKVVATGLDTVFLKPVSELFQIAETLKEKEIATIRSFSWKRRYADGIMIWNGDLNEIFKNYSTKNFNNKKLEQNITFKLLQKFDYDIKIINDKIDGIYSFKKFRKKFYYKNTSWKDIKIFLFHGNPRPWNVKERWFTNILKKKGIVYE